MAPKTKITTAKNRARVSSVGFAAPIADSAEKALDLNRLLIARPAATFFFRVSGSPIGAEGIAAGDIVIVDRSLTTTTNRTVVAIVEGQFVIKRNPTANDEVWGVVTGLIRQFTSDTPDAFDPRHPR